MVETKKTPSKRVKTAKKKPSNAKKVPKEIDASTQIRNICLTHVKNEISVAVKHWIEKKKENQDENEDFSSLVNDLYQDLKSQITQDQLKLLKLKQIELELGAVLTFVAVASYLSLCKFRGFAKAFQSLSRMSVNLVFLLSAGLDLSTLQPTQNPNWQKWQNVADAINEALKAERATIENFEKLQNLIEEENSEILDKKMKITDNVQSLLKHFKNAKESEDFFEIDKKLQ